MKIKIPRTLLMWSNASGDHIVKFILVYKFLNYPAMKKLNKSIISFYVSAGISS